jgi:hypothetical protein
MRGWPRPRSVNAAQLPLWISVESRSPFLLPQALASDMLTSEVK